MTRITKQYGLDSLEEVSRACHLVILVPSIGGAADETIISADTRTRESLRNDENLTSDKENGNDPQTTALIRRQSNVLKRRLSDVTNIHGKNLPLLEASASPSFRQKVR